MTLIGKRRRTPNFDPPPDARVAQVRDVNLADVWPTNHEIGPKGWTRDLCDRVEGNACRRGNVEMRAWHGRGTCGRHCRVRVAPPARVRVAPPERDPRGCGQHCLEELGKELALPGDTRVTPPGGVWVAPPGRVRVAPLKLDRPIVRVLPVHNDAGVSRNQA